MAEAESTGGRKGGEGGCDRPAATSTVGKIKEHINDFVKASPEEHKK